MLTNFNSNKQIRYPTEIQVERWLLKRNNVSGKKNTKQKELTTAFVSKSFVKAKKRIRTLLQGIVKSNKITLELIDETLGFVRGFSHMINVNSYIIFSPHNGIQVWYDHEGMI